MGLFGLILKGNRGSGRRAGLYTPRTFQILLVLIRNSREIVTKDDLMKTVWPDTFVEEANLSRNIFMLRKALGEKAQDHRYIVTIPGRGTGLLKTFDWFRSRNSRWLPRAIPWSKWK